MLVSGGKLKLQLVLLLLVRPLARTVSGHEQINGASLKDKLAEKKTH